MSEDKTVNGSYEVGYGRPPKTSQFPKGCSGNPKGRPTGTRNLKTDLMEELGEQITLNEGGKPKTLSKQRALLKSLTARAIKGDGRAVNALLNLMVRVLDLNDGDEAEDTALTPSDEAILENFTSRLLRQSNSKQRATKPRSNKKEKGHG